MIINSHCDTLSVMLERNCQIDNKLLHVNLNALKTLGKNAQFFACFVDAKVKPKNSLIYVLNMIEKMYDTCLNYNEYFELALNYDDVIKITDNNKCAAILWVEGGECLNGEILILKTLYRLGVRGMGLTWNYKNEIACGAGENIDTGVSEFGRKVIEEMNNLGMIVDVSHIGELGFWHVMNLSTSPVIASHSNAKKICNHKRNLSDEQIVTIAKSDGVIGINFYPLFLNNNGNASIDDALKHIDYIASLVGTKHIGIGSDFDGIETVPKGLENISKINDLLEALARKNYSQEQIEDISGNNFLRVLKQVLK